MSLNEGGTNVRLDNDRFLSFIKKLSFKDNDVKKVPTRIKMKEGER